MSDIAIDRRSLIATAGTIAAFAAAPAALAQATPTARRIAPVKPPRLLPFDPKAVGWLSEKILTSHHDNNYAGAVKRIDAIHGELAGLDYATAPGFKLAGLKREELIAWNSAALHELYFAGLTGGEKPSGKLGVALERDFGSVAGWAAEFSALGKALGGGSGWALLTWSARDGRLMNQWAADHTMTLAGGTPLLALDMYEHAYAMDFGAKAAAYVDAFMGGFGWANANRLFAALA
jgi:Fe-Mn family superoxide dismutase